MATKMLLIDDYDGDEAVETIRFGLDGKEYEIDLNETNAEWLRETMADVIDKARKIPRYKTATAPSAPPKRDRSTESDPTGKARRQAIRDWGRDNGFPDIKDLGYIPMAVVKAYDAAHPES